MSISQRGLAKLAKVSQATVSLALKNSSQIPSETRSRICKLASEHGYRRDAALASVMAVTRGYSSRLPTSTLALFLGVYPGELQENESYQQIVLGVEERCLETGYSLDRFWLWDETISPARQAAILKARGIGGIIVLWHSQEEIPVKYAPLYTQFACAVVGARPRTPLLHAAIPDHITMGNIAFDYALSRGYRRPSALIDPIHDISTDERLSVGCQLAQRRRATSPPLAPLVRECKHPEVMEWIKHNRPDFLFVTEEDAINHLRSFSRCKSMAFFHWDITPRLRNLFQGIDQNGRNIGAAGVDLVVGQLHRNDRGIPAFQKCVLIAGSPTEVSADESMANERVR